MSLLNCFKEGVCEAGIDEAGRGALAGPVAAAAVILPPGYSNPYLNDSKKLKATDRYKLREEITESALAWAVAFITNKEIDQINILRATFKAMHHAIDGLESEPEMLLVDGHLFLPFKKIPWKTIVKGDGIYQSIAAASVIAKTYRDDMMKSIALEYPGYGWERNMGYGTIEHRNAILRSGHTPYHRLTFRLTDPQIKLPF